MERVSSMQQYCKILIVDDEYIIRQGIKHLLDWEKYGFQVIGEAGNGMQALEMVEKDPPDIVLTDIAMPVMDGIELTKMLNIKNGGIQVIILSGYSDFEYVKSTFQNGAVDYILKPTLNPKELLSVLQKAVQRIPNLALKSSAEIHIESLLNQFILGFTDILQTGQLKKQFPLPCLRILGINRKICKNNSVINSFMGSGVYEMLGAYHPYPFNINDDIALVVFNYDHPDEATLSHAVRETVKKLSAASSGLFFVLSDPFYRLEDIRTVYNDRFCKLTERRFYFKNVPLMAASKFPPLQEYEKFDTKRFTSQLTSMNFEQALQMLREYVDRAVSEYRMNEPELKAFLESMLYNLISELEELNLNAENLSHLKLNYLSSIEAADYAEDFLKVFHDICGDFSIIIQNYHLKINNDAMKRITAYLQDHYSEPITLNDIAKKFNFSYYYLSSYFSAHSDEGFSEYLNRVRIEKSLELLRNKSIPISEISALVGYSDHSYFCKVFKKFTGHTPSEYRKGQG